MTYSGWLATRNRIETLQPQHFCGFRSVHSSKPSVMMSFGAMRGGTKLRNSTMRARIWASREREKLVGSYSSGDEFADFGDCEVYLVYKGRYNGLNVVSLGDCSRKGPARNDYPFPLVHLSSGLRDGRFPRTRRAINPHEAGRLGVGNIFDPPWTGAANVLPAMWLLAF
jgi:hypothetical protein